MKQHITLNQWKELEESKQIEFIKGCKTTLGVPIWESVTIGQMIEFVKPVDSNPYDGGFIDITMDSQEMDRKPKGWMVCNGPYFNSTELCDALWEAVKGNL